MVPRGAGGCAGSRVSFRKCDISREQTVEVMSDLSPRGVFCADSIEGGQERWQLFLTPFSLWHLSFLFRWWRVAEREGSVDAVHRSCSAGGGRSQSKKPVITVLQKVNRGPHFRCSALSVVTRRENILCWPPWISIMFQTPDTELFDPTI